MLYVTNPPLLHAKQFLANLTQVGFQFKKGNYYTETHNNLLIRWDEAYEETEGVITFRF
jgi:hypothetical protein